MLPPGVDAREHRVHAARRPARGGPLRRRSRSTIFMRSARAACARRQKRRRSPRIVSKLTARRRRARAASPCRCARRAARRAAARTSAAPARRASCTRPAASAPARAARRAPRGGGRPRAGARAIAARRARQRAMARAGERAQAERERVVRGDRLPARRCALARRGPAPQSQRLLIAGSPRASRASFTGCACSSIWISVSSASPRAARRQSRPAACERRRRRARCACRSRAHQRAASSARTCIAPAKCPLSAAHERVGFLCGDRSASAGTTTHAVAHHAQVHRVGARPASRRPGRRRRRAGVSAPAGSGASPSSKASLQPVLQRCGELRAVRRPRASSSSSAAKRASAPPPKQARGRPARSASGGERHDAHAALAEVAREDAVVVVVEARRGAPRAARRPRCRSCAVPR